MKKNINKIPVILILFALCFLSGCGNGSGGVSPESLQPPQTAPFSAVPTLNLGLPVVTGSVVTFPLVISNSQYAEITSIQVDIVFDETQYTPIVSGSALASAVLGAASSLAGKQIYPSTPQSNVLRLVIYDLGGNKSIADGVIAQVSFSIASSVIPQSNLFTIIPEASDSKGNPATILAPKAS